ncbi:MAG: glycosyltransferase [Planctomycetota bacterium]|nr:glycosyltransferase [Planctomycetota bacterium]
MAARKAIPLQSELQFLRFLCRFGSLSLSTFARLPRADLYYLHSPAQFLPVYLMSKLSTAPSGTLKDRPACHAELGLASPLPLDKGILNQAPADKEILSASGGSAGSGNRVQNDRNGGSPRTPRFIYDAHDFYSGLEPRKGRQAIMRDWVDPFYRRVEALCVRHASAVVTVCPGIAELLHRRYGCRPVVIRNCHDERLDRYAGVGLRDTLRLPPEAFLIVAVGNAKEGQATDTAIEALSTLPDHVHLAFVGTGYDSSKTTVRHKDLAGRIHFVAPVKPFQVVPFIRSADAAILLYYPRSLNYQFSLPNRFFQSVAAGLPLLYPGLAEIKRIADEHRIGIEIEPRTPESIAAGLRRLLHDPHLRCALKENSQKAGQALRWEKEETVLRDVIERVLGDRPG